MNFNPKAIRILAFGDSNTWGRVPGEDNKKRFDSNIRWTGILQKLLGEEYEIIEEGLNGRTTHLESPNKNGKNGKTYFYSCLESQNPIDIIILSLGGNNLKSKYKQTPEDIGLGIEQCLEMIGLEGRNKDGTLPITILVPPIIIEEVPRVRGDETIIDLKGGKSKSIELPEIYEKIAKKKDILFADWNKVAKASPIDGIHLDAEEHEKIAQFFYEILSKLTVKN
ncbi:acylhydrolase [Candidatus Nomurabacteria bacterium]|nr:acylhydrolase [Candidatus Nomurabacteria bacterium]MCB9827022.1 acylhydrolase [Candidatus Nomurabacteria bacterium]MCB9827948.1 acylhydrolase [Candidatus Nomurabacteria bacterium]